MKVIYGIHVKEEGDEYVDMIEAALNVLTQVMVQGKYLVEFLPFLRYVPTWVPGAGRIHRLSLKWKRDNARAVNRPYEYAVANQVK